MVCRMVAWKSHAGRIGPFGLAVSGEAIDYVDALQQIVGPRWLETYRVDSDGEVLELVREGVPDAMVLDDDAIEVDTLKLLRTIRQVNQALLVVLVTGRADRRWLEEALRLAAFSVVVKPLRLEELLVQIHRMMVRMDAVLRRARY
jgi:DNA-binding NtrC family response regulator